MGIGAEGNLVLSCFEDIAAALDLDSFGVKRRHVFGIDREIDRLGSAGLDHIGLREIDKVNRGFLNTAVGIRRCEVYFHDILTGDTACILYSDVESDCLVVRLEVLDLLLKGRVGETISERILDMILIFDRAVVGSGLIILVAYIDAFNIIDKGKRSFICGICCGDLCLQVIHIVVGHLSDIVDVRCREQVFYKCIDRSAGRVHRAAHNFTECSKSCDTGAGCQKNSADLRILIDPSQFHCIVSVDDHNNLVKLGADHLDQVFFSHGELEVRLSCLKVIICAVVPCNCIHIAVVAGRRRDLFRGIISSVEDRLHVSGKVCAFTAASADNDDSCIRILVDRLHHVFVVNADRRLRNCPVLRSHGDRRTLSAVLHIHAGEAFVGLKAGVLHGLQDADRGCGTGGSGSGSSVDRIGGRPAEHIQLLRFFHIKRQEPVVL